MATRTLRTNDRRSPNDDAPPKLPLRKESYTTWLYLALAVATIAITILGFWRACSATS